MPMQTVQVTLSGVTHVSTANLPFQELRLNPDAADYVVGEDATLSDTKYFAKVVATGSGVIIGNGPAAIAVGNLKNLYLKGTDGHAINLGVITL